MKKILYFLLNLILIFIIFILCFNLIKLIKEKNSIKVNLNYIPSLEKSLSNIYEKDNFVFEDKSIFYIDGDGTTFVVNITNNNDKFYLKGANVKLYNSNNILLSSLYCNIDFNLEKGQTASCTVKTSKNIFNEFDHAEYTIYGS